MPTAFEFCRPTAAKIVPDGPDWLHEIKYDGYRLRVERQGRDVRALIRNGRPVKGLEEPDAPGDDAGVLARARSGLRLTALIYAARSLSGCSPTLVAVSCNLFS
jgi:ATP-dependent DNA ligase